jgi:uncharacterized protein YoxC
MAITLVVLAAFIIPALIEIRRTAAATRDFLSSTDTELKPAIKELRETLADLKLLTHGAADKVEDIETFMEAVGDTGRNLRTINTVVGSVAGLLGGSSLWLTGARVAGRYILERLSKKRG